ncbi:MAG: guanylate kinase [Alphaproteobacteria bacterium]|nr:guanylate kinase [Alphaproteobacteria bacterium]
MILVLVGESASGKTTLAKMFEEETDFSRVITYTTRPMREGEQNGVDYYFISDEQFDEMGEKGQFIEHAEYRGWKYGTAMDSLVGGNKIVVLTPTGARAMKRRQYQNIYRVTRQIKIVYIEVDRRSRLIKMLKRGDDIEEAYRRSLSDVGQFDAFEAEADFTVHNNCYEKSVDEVFQEIKKFIETEVT